MKIDRCVCNQKTFQRILEEAEASGCSSMEQLLASVGVGDKCGMCRPYIEVSLETGQTEFTEIIQSKRKP